MDHVASEKNRLLYNTHAAKAAPDDFWSQVRRTVRGRPVDEAQINLIVDAVCTELDLRVDDVLLDLCCGNGALTDRIFTRCRGGLGVDFAENLIAIAQQHFATAERLYAVGDVVDFCETAGDTSQFTKALCYGAFALLAADSARRMLQALCERFGSITRVVIGNLPDRALLHSFYDADKYRPGIEYDHESPLGIWRTEDEFRELAAATGWTVEFRRMPVEFFGAAYRYDAILKRP